MRLVRATVGVALGLGAIEAVLLSLVQAGAAEWALPFLVLLPPTIFALGALAAVVFFGALALVAKTTQDSVESSNVVSDRLRR